jgi:hypothetical protein
VPEGLRHELRPLRECEGWVGEHAGQVVLTTGSGGVIIGEMRGVDGLSSEPQSECCTPEQSHGTLTGTGEEALTECSLTAVYTATFRPGSFDPEMPPCESDRWSGWNLQLTGVLACPCGVL